MDNKYDSTREKRSRVTSIKNLETLAKWFFIALAIGLLVVLSGCEEGIQNAKSSGVVYVPYYNENCVTIAQIKGSDGKIYAEDIAPGEVGEIVVRRPAFSKGDTEILVATSYDPPQGCRDYGRDDKRIDFYGGDIDTDEWYIRLRPD